MNSPDSPTSTQPDPVGLPSARVLQVSVSPGGMPKYAIESAKLTPLGLATDGHNNPKVHGGPRKAVLLVTVEGIEELKQLGFPLFYGALGENLTTLGLNRRQFRAGQRYRVGEVELELTQPRGPCDNLNPYGPGIQKALYDAQVKAGDFTSPRWGLSGFYASVVRTGVLRPGDPIQLLSESA